MYLSQNIFYDATIILQFEEPLFILIPFIKAHCIFVLKKLHFAVFMGKLLSPLVLTTVGIFHNRNPSNLDSSDQQIRLCCDLNLNLDYESVDLPLEVDQWIQIHWITQISL